MYLFLLNKSLYFAANYKYNKNAKVIIRLPLCIAEHERSVAINSY